MVDTLILLTVLAAWIILNVWVLPRFGIKTCLGGFCNMNSDHCTSPQHKPAESNLEPVQRDDVHDSRLQHKGELK
ncbi:MAG: hypothetical protein ABIK07_22085 [Planctomycetota bacterium]|jgi:hypothetical protein|uniref:hypothetical protein n=1 Tax=uncultured Gimesia sp. TaxID=1678688 RepID=UPI002626E7EE|nr:hypothetical protein [uncultured Gimesia sp.]